MNAQGDSVNDRREVLSDDGEEQPSFLSMIRLVAISVAITILVFFTIGYLFGRLFL